MTAEKSLTLRLLLERKKCENKRAELISTNHTPNMFSVSKHVVENDVSFFTKLNCQEKQQKN